MSAPHEPRVPDERQLLRRQVRDLVALSALPAMWGGRALSFIAGSLLDVLHHMLRLEMSYIRLNDPDGGPALEEWRPRTPDRPPGLDAALDTLLTPGASPTLVPMPGPGARGAIHVVASPIDYQGEVGALIVGSQRADFPTEEERVLLNVAANQAATMLRRQRAEEALRASQERLALALETGGLGFWELDLATGALACSAICKAILGLPPEAEITYAVLFAAIHPDDAARVRAAIDRAVADHAEYETEYCVIWPDGGAHAVMARGRCIDDADGNVQRMVSVTLDITDRQRLEQQQRDFIAMVAHDLKNPLTTMKGYAQLMQRRGIYNERTMATILAQANRMEGLIDDLRDVVRIDVNGIALHRERVDLAALVRTCVEEAQTLTDAHTIRLMAPAEPIVGWWDAGRLTQVIANLLSNAVKYSPESGEIRVAIEGGGGTARVAVRDEGIGMSPDVLTRVFERFYRAQGGIIADRKGLGLGLSISKALVEAHGGQIAVESIPGEGSIFRVMLPLAPATESSAPHGAATVSAS